MRGGEERAHIFSYDPREKYWKDVGKLTEPRYYFAVQVIPDVHRFCPG